MTLAVSFSFVTPLGLLFALASLVPVVAFLLSTRRARRVRTALGLDRYGGAHPAWTTATIVAVVLLLAVALAQPVVRMRTTQHVREDAEAFYVFDVSRSMLAADSASDPMRMERAQEFGLRMRRRLTELPSGVASLTDRVLPHLFPTADEEVFTAAVEQSVGVDRPASRAMDQVTTLFAAFDSMPGDTFFTPGARERVVVVLTDGESAPYDTAMLRQALAGGPTDEVRRRRDRQRARARLVPRQADPELPARPEPRSACTPVRRRDRCGRRSPNVSSARP